MLWSKNYPCHFHLKSLSRINYKPSLTATGLGSLIFLVTQEKEPNISEDQKSLSQKPSNRCSMIYVMIREKMATLPLSLLEIAHNSSQFLYGMIADSWSTSKSSDQRQNYQINPQISNQTEKAVSSQVTED